MKHIISWFNKLQMFDRFRDKKNLYFDLDLVIKGPVPDLLRKDFTLCHAWWRTMTIHLLIHLLYLGKARPITHI